MKLTRRPTPSLAPRPVMPATPDAAAATIVHALLRAGYTGPQTVDIMRLRDGAHVAAFVDEFSARLERAMPGIGALR